MRTEPLRFSMRGARSHEECTTPHGSLQFTKVLRDTTIDITLRMDRMIAERGADSRSTLGRDVDFLAFHNRGMASNRPAQ
jgi:hypothetical protein